MVYGPIGLSTFKVRRIRKAYSVDISIYSMFLRCRRTNCSAYFGGNGVSESILWTALPLNENYPGLASYCSRRSWSEVNPTCAFHSLRPSGMAFGRALTL
jgi:hypothetical protein